MQGSSGFEATTIVPFFSRSHPFTLGSWPQLIVVPGLFTKSSLYSGISATTYCCIMPFQGIIPSLWDFGHNLLLSQDLSENHPFTLFYQALSLNHPFTLGFLPQLIVFSGPFMESSLHSRISATTYCCLKPFHGIVPSL
jgi:hypothetical protein